MTNPTIANMAIAQHVAQAKAVVIEEVNDNLMYVGYCTSECTGYDDPKWRIERIQKEGTIQTVFTANGSSAMNQKWTERKSLRYAPTINWE